MSRFIRPIIFGSLLVAAMLTLNCFGVETSASGLSLQLNQRTGAYELSSKQPPWKFSGSLNARLKRVANTRGHDALGDYRQISFEWQADKKPMKGAIRIYEADKLAMFSQTSKDASEMPPAAFPNFQKLPGDLHVFSYGQQTFSPPHFKAQSASTPWLLFDDNAESMIISPANNFFVASLVGDGHTNVATGFNEELRNLPAGFTQRTLLAFGKGINNTWDIWGRALVELGGATRPSNEADDTLKYLGYWTDNGAKYYYNYDLDKGYAGTLQALVDRYRLEQIPIRYLQLDSWWYYKTTTDADGKQGSAKKSEKLPEGEWNRYGGLLEYRAHTNLFPNGLDAFHKSVGLPFVTHNRWIDRASPYHEKYKIVGVAAVDPKWWDDIADYLKSSGIVTYEQDWLDRIYTFSDFGSELGVGRAFLDNMSRACAGQGVTMQYCMPYPCFFLQGSRYPNLTTIRTSGDRFNKDRWNDFLYTSRLAKSMGIWPWTDVFMSTERENTLLSTLSAGPVGIGDLMGSETKTNLSRAVRTDGVIVKPDEPAVPMDQTYLADAKHENAPLIVSTSTDHNGTKTEYVFAFNGKGKLADNVEFKLADLGLRGPAYVCDGFSGDAKRIDSDGAFSAPLAENADAFYVVAPVGKSGIAFLGDKDKFVGTGRQRIDSLQDEPGKLTVGVVLAETENSVVLHGYAAESPKVTAQAGTAGEVQYDSATGHFTVEIKPDQKTFDKTGPDPIRRVSVIFETR